MGLVNAVYNWGSVKALYATVSSMNVAGLVAVVLAIVWAVRFERGFGDYLNLVSPGDGYVWMTVIISSAVLCSPAYIIGLKSCLSLRMESSKPDLDEQKIDELQRVANRLLFFHVIACLLSGFLVAVLNATYLALLSGFQQKSRDGLMQAIQRYGSDVTVKERVDAVQTELECCGDNGYEDWFRVSWLKLAIEGPEEHENGPRLEEQLATEDQEEEPLNTADVPFSCCSNDIPKPCVHHDILNPSAAYDYNPKHLTIATLGCRSKIIDRAATVKIFISGYLAVLTVYQMTLSFLSRLLQTAHSNDLYIGSRKSRYRVWILFSPETTSSEAPLMKRIGKNSQSRKPSIPPPTPTFSSSSSSSSSSEEEIASKTARKVKSSSAKMFSKIRSRISSAKSKSLPLIKSSISIAKKLRAHRKDVHMSEASEEEEQRRPGRRKGEKGRGQAEKKGESDSKRIKEHATRSEVVVKRDYDSPELSPELSPGGTSITEDLPPPPPPPPFALTFEMEREDANTERVVVNSFEEQIPASQNSGRRVKVLERFGRIEGREDRATQHRESGGADFSSSDRTSGSDRSKRVKFSPADVYDRFRGSLQHTLARREAVQIRRGHRGRAHRGRGVANLETRRSSLLARLGCKNVPPSYRLLANLEDKKWPTVQTHPLPSPPPLPQNPWSVHCRKRQCSVCHRPVQQSPASSRGSVDSPRTTEAARAVAPPTNESFGHKSRSRENHVPWNRSSRASRSILRR